MLRLALAFLFLLGTAPLGGAQDLVLTGIIDGPLSGGTPKGVELYVLADIADLSVYGLGSANNGGGSDGQEFTFPADAATEGDYLYVASEAQQFTAWFGFAPDYTSGAMTVNGDDAVELFQGGAVVDVFGEIDINGTGEPWDYLDGWAYRRDGTGPDGSAFALASWAFSGTNALDGYFSNDEQGLLRPMPVGTYRPLLPGAAGFATGPTPGWRQLASPVDGLTVADLAASNMVSGVPGYRGTGCNGVSLYTGYSGDPADGVAGYLSPSGASAEIVSGAGFFWYFYGDSPPPEQSATCGGSVSAALPASVSASGPSAVGNVVWDPERSDAEENDGGDGFYLGGNPYRESFDLEFGGGYGGSIYGIDYGSKLVTFSDIKQAWDPENGGYTMFVALEDGGDDGAGGSATSDDGPVWQGVWLESDFPPQPAEFIVYVSYFKTGSVGAPVIARDVATALREGQTFGLSQIRLTLRGTLDTGASVYDDAIGLLFSSGASVGWDRLDGSKLDPFAADFADLGMIGLGRDGTPLAKAVESLPVRDGEATVAAQLRTSGAGAFTLSWAGAALPPGWTAVLRDRTTGTTADLVSAGDLAFQTDAAVDAERFEITVQAVVVDSEATLEASSVVSLVAPNPTAGHARMFVELAAPEHVVVRVYDAVGRLVRTVLDERVAAGDRVVLAVPTAGLAPGVYLVRVEGESFAETRRMTVSR